MIAPRLFISYSWSSQDHERWVLDLATTLTESGIDVILDKWFLREGNDSIHFMEQMVTDPTITKVAIISDKTYAEKADGRVSGVGTETQIISRNVYEKQDQSKFVVVLPELDEKGKPYLPTYYKGRIYIDLSSPDRYASQLENLVRWVFDKPLYVKPGIGKPPAFLEEEPAKSLGTSLSFSRSMDALKNAKSFADGAVNEYLTTFAENLERLRISFNSTMDIDDQVFESIERFTPNKNDFVQLILVIAQYRPTGDMRNMLHRFFEQLLPYLNRQEHVNAYKDHDFDNFRFIVHELYLYTIAVLIRYERFDFADRLLGTPYYISANTSRKGESVNDFTCFHEFMPSFRNRDRKINKISSRALLIMQRAEASKFDFKWLMQADFVLYLRATMVHKLDIMWWPETLLYSGQIRGPMEIFARSQSASYYEQCSKVIKGISAEQLRSHINGLKASILPHWTMHIFSPDTLTGIDKLASMP